MTTKPIPFTPSDYQAALDAMNNGILTAKYWNIYKSALTLLSRTDVAVVPKVLDENDETIDEEFHKEFQKQAKYTLEKYGKVALASGPFIDIIHRAMIRAGNLLGKKSDD